jgi:competence protein ComEA
MMGIIKRVALVTLLFIALPAFSADKLNINTATVKQISKAMTGVGKQKAELIVSYRHSHGPFTNLDQLMKVKGIGPKTVEDNRENLTVQ